MTRANCATATLLFRDEAIVVSAGDVHGELSRTLAWSDCLCQASDSFDLDAALDLLFVDVVDGFVGDCQRAFLSPVEHVGLFHFAGIHEYICDKSIVNSRALGSPTGTNVWQLGPRPHANLPEPMSCMSPLSCLKAM